MKIDDETFNGGHRMNEILQFAHVLGNTCDDFDVRMSVWYV